MGTTINQLSTITKEAKVIEYKGGSTNTATVNVTDNIITVDAKIDITALESKYADVILKYTSIINTFDEIRQDISSFKAKLIEQDTKIANQDIKLDQHSEKILRISTRVTELDEKISKVNSELQARINQEVEELNTAITNLGTALNGKIDTKEAELTEKINLVNSRITELENRLHEIIEQSLVEIKAQINSLFGHVQRIDLVNEEQTTKILDNTEKIGILNTELNKLSEKVDNISVTIIPIIEAKIEELSKSLDNKLSALDTKLSGQITATKQELETKIQETSTQVKEELVPAINTVNARVDSLSEDVVNNKIYLENKIDTSVATLTTKLDNKLDASVYEHDKAILDTEMAKKGGGMYYDSTGEYDPSGQSKSYWYMTSNNDNLDPKVIAGPYNFGSGGGGGGGSITKVSIEAVDWPSTVAYGVPCEVKVLWSSLKEETPTGNGTLSVYINGVLSATKKNTPQGLVSLDISNYLVEGTNTVEIRATDAYSSMDKVIQEITAIQVKLDSVFNPDRVFSNSINYTYIPYGAGLLKTTHFIIDGIDIGTQQTKLSGEQQTYVISDLTHGSHTLKVYFTCVINEEEVKSNELFYDLIYEVEGELTPIISSTFNALEQEQYTSFSIPYRVYTPTHDRSNVKLLINDVVVRELVDVPQDTQYWEYKPADYGLFKFQIQCGTTFKTFNINIKESELDIHAVTQDLKLYLTSTGRSNAEAHPEIWNDEEHHINCTLSNFNFVSDGWLQDSEGNTVLKVTGDARVEIPYMPFKEDFRTSGKTFEFEFSTDSIKDYETILISCWSGDRGIYITPQLAKIKSQLSELQTQYKEDDHVRIAFVVEKIVETRVIYMYVNGIMCGAFQYSADDNFRQLTPVNISIGSNDATINIYNIRVYDNNLNRKQVVNNWVADTQSGELKKARYLHNDNYNDSGEIVISKLPSDIPYIIWDIDPLPQYKGDKRKGQAYYTDPVNPSKSFKLPTKDGVGQGDYNVQGTSSSVYPVKNIRLKSKGGFIDNDLVTHPEFFITEGGIGANYFTYKVDYASSEGANNVELTKLYNDAAKANGILNPAQKLDNRVRVGIDGFPIVAFHRTADGVDSFCTKANFNNDKANESVYGFLKGDESWEITNNSADEGNFKKAVTPETFGNAFEIRFPDEDGYSDLSKLQPMTEWVVSTDPEQATNNPLPESKQYTYETVVRSEDGTYSKRTITSPLFTTDSQEYRLTKFKAELKDWFNVDTTVFYYIYTHLFLMIDSRAKNAFPTYFASRVEGDGGNRWFWLPYDMDTAIGINNEGKLVFDYNLEDTDKIGGENVFNGQDSVMWNNLRKMFDGEIGEMYSELRTSGSLISYDEVESRFEKHQAKWSETIFNEDSYQKYIKVLRETGDNYLEMLQGSKAEQRKWWLYNRFKYFDSKYLAGDAKSDILQFRAYGKADITLIPYADIYATVSYANAAGAVVSVRAKRGQAYTLPNPLPASASDQETYIYSASQLKSVGDLSPFRPDTVKAANAIKLQELKVGDGAEGYENPNLKELTLGKNTLLKTLDVRNCINLTQAINIKDCTNIEEVYFDNTKITGISLPVGGILKKLHLPDTLTNLTIRNQVALQELQIAGTSNVQTLWLENIPSELIDAQRIIMAMPQGSEVRLIGFNQIVSDAQEIYDLYNLLDTMTGLNAQGETVEAAQISGTININNISYADYITLTNWVKNGKPVYRDVNIVYNTMRCTVNFWNESVLHDSQIVVKGKSAETPEVPQKASTAQYYYTFNSWDKDYSNVQEDMDINAIFDEHIQEYEFKFNLQSTIPTPIPSQIIKYGEKATRPADPYIEGAIFNGWFNEPNGITEYDFDTVITGPKEIYATWTDTTRPNVYIERVNADTFRYTLTDNIAITAYAITESEEQTPSWISIEPITPYIGECIIDHAGKYYVWARDNSGKTANNYIEAYAIVSTTDTGSGVDITEGTKQLNGFAIQGTEVKVSAKLYDHYENLELYIDDVLTENPYDFTIDKNIDIKVKCNPITYTVHFELNGHGVAIEDQYIVYNNLVVKPENQFEEGLILKDWYKDQALTQKWDFDNDRVSENITLYAFWDTYNEPTLLTVRTTETNQKIVCSVYQDYDNGIDIDWGDGSAIENKKGRLTSLFFEHIYETAGDYIVKVYFKTGTRNRLGAGYYNPEARNVSVIEPAETLIGVEFAYNMAYTSQYAFGNSINLKELTISKYMTKLEVGMFYNCTGLENVIIPSNISVIENSAFNGCSGLTGEFTIPNSVRTIGDSAFKGCSGITKFNISNNIESIGQQAFAGTGITEFVIPETISTIKYGLFNGCTSLQQLEIPENVLLIESYAFTGCENLEKLIIRNSQTVFGEGSAPYHLCKKLKTAGPIGGDYNIEFAWDEKIPNSAFYNDPTDSGLTTIVLPNTLKEIGSDAFMNNVNLSVINLPEGLEKIDNGAFFGCSGLSEIILPESLKIIGNNVFYRCAGLQNITVPFSMTSLGDRAFANCTALKEAKIYMPSSANKPVAYTNAWFANCNARLILHICDIDFPEDVYGPVWNFRDESTAFIVQKDLK